MRRSVGKTFAIIFLKSLVFFMLFTSIIIGSYKLTMNIFGIEDLIPVETIAPVMEEAAITQPRLDGISKHLIYSVDDESGDIDKLILEIFNSEECKFYFITIPIKTQLALSDSLHKKLVLIKPSMPQLLKISAITGYFPDEKAYEYGVLMIEDLLDINISYYTVVPQTIYETVFETETLDRKSNNQQVMESVYPREVFSDKFLKYLHTINTETQLRNYIKELYVSINSNLPLEAKLNYIDSYINTSGKDILFELIAGENSNSAYTISKAMVTEQLKAYLNE